MSQAKQFLGAAVVAALVMFIVLEASVAVAGPAPAGRPDAAPFLGLPETLTIISERGWALEPAFPALAFNDPVFFISEPNQPRLWVCEREGRILSFLDDDETTELRTVLDLRDTTQGDGDSGLLAMAFHPQFAQTGAAGEGKIFIGYAHIDPPDEEDPDAPRPLHFRVSRFDFDNATGIADPDSELILIDQLDNHVWHQGGAMFFHPADGFLYITVGDEGGGRCVFGNCQRIDRDLFAGVLRIDVDRIGPPVSHPIPRQPDTGTTANYFIPDDNPFVGVPNALEEFYAIGLRSPHRMTYDPVDGLGWIADVGQRQREEIDILAPGANYQWNVLEGTLPFDADTEPPSPSIGVWTDPIFDYGRAIGGTIIGGYVYRGTKHPELVGDYIYADFITGSITALQYELEGNGVKVLGNVGLVATGFQGRADGITSLGVDAAGEIYVLTLGEVSNLQRLVRENPGSSNMPPTLSETGLFADLATLDPISALVPYDVRSPLWSDGTAKRRWMSVPSNATIGYRSDIAWKFPPGTVFVKHFEIQVDEREPDNFKRLETRVLVVQTNGNVYGVTYKWRADGSEADLLIDRSSETLSTTALDGSITLDNYDYPSPNDCLLCHDRGAGHLLGLKSRQLAQDQLQWLADSGFFETAPTPEQIAAVETLAPLDDETASMTKRARSYLDSNCSHCHGSQDLDRSLWDARFDTPFEEQGILYGLVLGEYGGNTDRVVRPVDLESSILYLRSLTTDQNLRMPPLARNRTDEAFIELLEAWILSLTNATTTTLPIASTTTLPIDAACGDPVHPFGLVSASDALHVLRAAVGLRGCGVCTCDASGNGIVTASDALRVLSHAVGLPAELNCPSCF